MNRVESPLPLALLRIVLPLVILASPELYDATTFAASPERLGFVPEGLGLVARLPLGPGAVRVLQGRRLLGVRLGVAGMIERDAEES